MDKGTDLSGAKMVVAELVAERIAIDSYREMIKFIGDKNSTTQHMLEDILSVEEEHADDMAGLLEVLTPRPDIRIPAQSQSAQPYRKWVQR